MIAPKVGEEDGPMRNNFNIRPLIIKDRKITFYPNGPNNRLNPRILDLAERARIIQDSPVLPHFPKGSGPRVKSQSGHNRGLDTHSKWA